MAEVMNQIAAQNREVTQSGYRIRSLLKLSISRLSYKGKAQLTRSLRLRLRKDYGEINQLTYQFSRHGVFFHKGVGRGYILSGGRVIRGSKGDSLFRTAGRNLDGPLRRRPKEWFNPVLDKEVPKLADQIASFKADSAAQQLIKIK